MRRFHINYIFIASFYKITKLKYCSFLFMFLCIFVGCFLCMLFMLSYFWINTIFIVSFYKNYWYEIISFLWCVIFIIFLFLFAIFLSCNISVLPYIFLLSQVYVLVVALWIVLYLDIFSPLSFYSFLLSSFFRIKIFYFRKY